MASPRINIRNTVFLYDYNFVSILHLLLKSFCILEGESYFLYSSTLQNLCFYFYYNIFSYTIIFISAVVKQ